MSEDCKNKNKFIPAKENSFEEDCQLSTDEDLFEINSPTVKRQNNTENELKKIA